MEFCVFEKANNSIAMIKLYRALFKYENEREIGWDNCLTTL